MCVCMCVIEYVCACLSEYAHTDIQTDAHADTHIHGHTHTQDAHAHILTHARIHIRKHTQTRTHTRTKNRARLILTPCFLNIRRYGHYGYGCVQETSLHALRQTQSTLQQNGTLAELQTEHLSPPLINQMPSGFSLILLRPHRPTQ